MAADEYRRRAAECLRIAGDVINSQSRSLLMHMSQAWLRLAHQSEKNLTSNICFEPLPPLSEIAAVQQQQEQIQVEKEE